MYDKTFFTATVSSTKSVMIYHAQVFHGKKLGEACYEPTAI